VLCFLEEDRAGDERMGEEVGLAQVLEEVSPRDLRLQPMSRARIEVEEV
jgi:hypothetical protein